jgi:glycosyltransferase involved in cell wall biosynthesis
VQIAVPGDGPRSTVAFDWHATAHAAAAGEPCLVLGYNTALFGARLRWAGVPHAINMDGVEWRRDQWGPLAKAWFWINERAGCRLGDHLIADHPEIARHLATRTRAGRITTIPYGADRIEGLDPAPVRALGLEPGRYLTLVARAEPENSILEVVQGHSMRARGVTLAVIGAYRDDVPYHRAVRTAAGPEVRFLGAVYDRPLLAALREHSLAYVHGHRVGGTNPSLVEALGAGNAVIAHDNVYNRWVAGEAGCWFGDAAGYAAVLEALLAAPAVLGAMRAAARRRFDEAFTWPAVLSSYERLILERLGPAARRLPSAADDARARR